MMLSVHRNHKAGKDDDDVGLHVLGCRVDILGTKGGGGGGGGGGRLYTNHHTVTTRMTSALRWAEMRAVLMFY